MGTGLPAFYPIIDTGVCASRGIDPAAAAAACFRGGARLLQLRQKRGDGGALLALADRVAAIAREHDALLVVNDRADIARLSGAAGVHVGQDDLGVADVRSILGPAAIVGLSTHDEAQVDQALGTPATYLAVGPIFQTQTKDTGYTARGLDLVRYASGRGKPVVAIGGITLDGARLALTAGATSVAVIGDLFAGGDLEARTRAFVARLAAAGR